MLGKFYRAPTWAVQSSLPATVHLAWYEEVETTFLLQKGLINRALNGALKQGPIFSQKNYCWPVGGREDAHWIDLGVRNHFKVVIPEKGGS